MTRAALVIAAGWAAIFAAVLAFRPLMPVDETRYLSVAWEMMVQGHWILPTLNFEPYSHKPPMLFWLARLGWEIFGVGTLGPRIMMLGVVAALYAMTAQLARRLVPDSPQAPAHAMLALAALPLAVVYASLIMFDTLMALCVTGAWLAVLNVSYSQRMRDWLWLGLAIGAGVLAKGPAALVYMLPVALLGPVWTPGQNWRRWYGGIGIAFATGAAIALAWAIPAALAGGDAYAQKIFVTQSAGRMVKAFDHREPFWFYGPVLAGFLLPLLAWPALWRRRSLTQPLRFLLCAAVPAIVFFSIISSKQIHYMVPVMPAFALAAAILIRDVRMRWAALPVALLALPSVAMIAAPGIIGEKMFGLYPWLAGVHVAFGAALALFAWRRPAYAFHALAAASLVLVAVAHVQAGKGLLPRYDLAPLVQAIKDYEDRPLASAPKYDGEFGFLFRATGPIESVGREHIAEWFAANPDGVLIARDKPGRLPQDFKEVFRQDFRPEEVMVIYEKN